MLKYFYEKSDLEYEKNNEIWKENRDRFVFLQTNLSLIQQVKSIKYDLENNANKDILAIRFPTHNDILNNFFIKNIVIGNGVIYETNKIWYPKEVWIYSPVN